MRQKKVMCVDADHKPTFKSWPVFKCLYAEIDHQDRKFILNDGKWFNVAHEFVARTNDYFAKIQYSDLALPLYAGGGEGAYNASVAAGEPMRFALLDNTKKVMHGGGRGQVEICDLFSIDRQLIHVKIYGKSSVLSHLFSQGFVSGQLIQVDSDFRRKIRKQLPPGFVELVRVDQKPSPDEFTIVYAISSDEKSDKFHLPFFSRVNLNNIAKILMGFGYKVELLKIGVDEVFSKTTTLPTSKKTNSKPANTQQES